MITLIVIGCLLFIFIATIYEHIDRDDYEQTFKETFFIVFAVITLFGVLIVGGMLLIIPILKVLDILIVWILNNMP